MSTESTPPTSKAARTAARKGRQRFSLYHTEGKDEAMKAWMAPYADAFRGCQLVLDVGCGPGHFLELLHARGIGSLGIDFDSLMVEACTSKGLNAEVADARTLDGWLERFDGIHAGHVIEHMDGETAVGFLEQCYESLQPGGLLVLRTPNWENPIVRHGGFWMDHTHVRPYPLALLQRLLEDLDFTIQAMGNEPQGWQDLYVLARKNHPVEETALPTIEGLKGFNLLLPVGATGWEQALKAYGTSFTADDDICLVLYVDPDWGSDEQMVLTAYETLGLDAEHGPDVVVVSKAQEGADEASVAVQVQGIVSEATPVVWRDLGLPAVAATTSAMRQAYEAR